MNCKRHNSSFDDCLNMGCVTTLYMYTARLRYGVPIIARRSLCGVAELATS